MAEATQRLGFPFIQVGQAQKDVTHNEALVRLDGLLHLTVASRSSDAPPISPIVDQYWIVGAAASGDWLAHENELARWTGSVWQFAQPVSGMVAWIEDEAIIAVYGAGIWYADFLPVHGLRIDGVEIFGVAPVAIAEPIGGSVIDAEVRDAFGQLIAYLRQQGILSV